MAQQMQKHNDEKEQKQEIVEEDMLEIIDAHKLTNENWRKILTKEEYEILRNKGCENEFSGKYNEHYPNKGYYTCKACNNPLYSSESKYKSGCGWPSFEKCFQNSIKIQIDDTAVEIICAKCNSHLGHVFQKHKYNQQNDPQWNQQRHCVNSLAIKYCKKPIINNLQTQILDLKQFISEK